MKTVILLLLACVATSYAGLDLTPDNFDSIVDGSKAAFVEFYAPWCGHCKSLAPDWETLGEAFAGTEVVIGKVDADGHKTLGSRFGISGFPTLKFFPKGSTTPEDYSGGRSLDELLAFVTEKTGVRSKIKKTVSNVVDLTPANFDTLVLDSTKDVLVEFYAPWCGHCKSLKPAYEIIATAFANEDSVIIAKVDADQHKDLGSRYEVTGFPTLKWFPKNNKEGETYSGPRDEKAIVDFVNTAAGTHRKTNGALSDSAGRIPTLDNIITKVHSIAEHEKEKLIKDAEDIAAKLVGDDIIHGKYYLKVLNTLKDTKDFVVNEAARLSRMIEGGALSPKKKDEFTKKKNILDAFST